MSSLTLVLPDGSRLAAPAACVVGRAPERSGFAPVALADPERVVSKNHVTLRLVGDLCEVTDLHSTNGSAIAVGGDWLRLEPGAPTHATVPCQVDCGGVIVAVERA